MIQLSNIGPPGRIRFARGSNPVVARHQPRRNNAGTDPIACRHAHRWAERIPYTAARCSNSASRSATTSSRSAIGNNDRKIAVTRRGNCGRPCILHCRKTGIRCERLEGGEDFRWGERSIKGKGRKGEGRRQGKRRRGEGERERERERDRERDRVKDDS